MAICVEEGLKVRVLAPRCLPETIVNDFLNEKIRWIRRKLDQQRSSAGAQETFSCADGARFLFLGKNHELRYQPSDKKRVSISLEGEVFQASVPWDMPADRIERAIAIVLEAWYRERAEVIIQERVEVLGRPFGVKPCDVLVRDQKRIWGSCYPRKRKIYINWRIVMAPMRVIDYVLTHELCHLREANHSHRFWREVAASSGQYRECVQWLKAHGPLMRFP